MFFIATLDLASRIARRRVLEHLEGGIELMRKELHDDASFGVEPVDI